MNVKQLGVAMALVAGLGMSGAVQANSITYWVEVDDAGDLNNPQDVGYLAQGITGSIGGTNDKVDVFRFRWLDPVGDNQMKVEYVLESNAVNLDVSLWESPTKQLFGVGGFSPGSYAIWTSVKPGIYLFKVAASQDPPRWSLNITQVPAAGDDDTIGPVPEPATLALFGLGLAGLGWSRRRTH